MKEKKSILFVNGHLNVGGVEKALVDLLSWLDYNRYDVDLLLLQGRGDYEDRIPKQVRIIERDTRCLEGPFGKVILRNAIRFKFYSVFFRIVQSLANLYGKGRLSLLKYLLPIRRHYDVAVAFRHDQCAEIVAYAVKAGKKLCWWHHGEVNLSDNKIQQIESLWGYFNKVVTVSEGCKRMLLDRFILDPEKIAVIPNLIDTNHIISLAGDVLPYDTESRTVIVSLSRLSPEKHMENAVMAARYLVDNGYLDFVWYIIGDGECGRDLKALIESEGLNEHFVLKGKLINPYPFLKSADVFVHPSYVESQGISVLEAMSLGVPVVAARSVGVESFLIDGENGVLVERIGGVSLAEGILTILRMNSDQCEHITSDALSMVREQYSPVSVINAFDGLINVS